MHNEALDRPSITACTADLNLKCRFSGVLVEDVTLKGQYYLYVRYGNRPVVEAIGLTRSKKSIVSQRKRKHQNITAPNRGEETLVSVASNFERISAYATVSDSTQSMMSVIPEILLNGFLNNQEENKLQLIKKSKKSDLFLTHSLDTKRIQNELDKHKHAGQYSYALRNAIFAGLVSTFDELIASLIKLCIRKQPKIIVALDKDVPYAEIVSAKSFEQLQSDLVDNVISDIMRKPRLEQIQWIEKYISDIKLKDALEKYEDFLEISERRNIYVHNDGYPSDEYIKKVGAISKGKVEIPTNMRIELTRKYALDSSDVLIEAYMILSQSAIRKMFKDMTPEDKEFVDSIFNQAAYHQIEQGRHESASRIARALLGGNYDISEITKKMAIVNRAIAEKKCGRIIECDGILNNTDWTSTRAEFNLCVAAIREDIDEVVSIIPRVKSSEMIGPLSYFEWPAFDWVRESPKFWETLEEVYGEEIRRAPSLAGSISDAEVEVEASE